jgi:membrane associated rhomboid family serine protease
VTVGIAIATALCWFFVEGLKLNTEAAFWGGFIPVRVGGVAGDEGFAPVFLTPLTATLVHADIIHLGLNLLFLVFCGRAIEGVLGGKSLVALYLVGAYAAAAAQYLVEPQSPIPMVGASGAISAVLGAYAVLFGRNKVKVANPRLALWLNALWLLVVWIILQAILGLTLATGGIQVAIAAHVGGFLAGLLLANPLLMIRYRRA